MKRRRRPNGRGDLSFAEALNHGAKLLEQGRAEEALKFLYQAASLEPDDVDAAVNLGGAYIMLGQYERATAILEEAAKKEPMSSKVWINLGAAYLGDLKAASPEQQESAIAAFERALELDPAAPSVNYNLGLIYRGRNEPETALKHFRRAAAINPLDQDARMLWQKMERLCAEGSEEEPGGADDGT